MSHYKNADQVPLVCRLRRRSGALRWMNDIYSKHKHTRTAQATGNRWESERRDSAEDNYHLSFDSRHNATRRTVAALDRPLWRGFFALSLLCPLPLLVWPTPTSNERVHVHCGFLFHPLFPINEARTSKGLQFYRKYSVSLGVQRKSVNHKKT